MGSTNPKEENVKGRGNVLGMPVGGQEEKDMASYTVYMDENGIVVVCMFISYG